VPRSQKRLLALVGALAVLLVVAALAYRLGMAGLEGETRDFWESLAWAAETISTTGYGRDSHWSHPAMVLFVVLLVMPNPSLHLTKPAQSIPSLAWSRRRAQPLCPT